MAQFPAGRVCFTRPARKKPRVYTERDVGRIIAYARNDGASDVLLFAYILQSFGLRKMQCIIFKVLDILNTAVFLGAILLLLKGMAGLVKVIKIVTFGKKSRVTLSLIEQFWPTKFTRSLAVFLTWTSSAELAIGTVTIFITAISNNVALYLLMKGVCEVEIQELKVELQPQVDTGSLYEDIADSITVLQSIISDNI